MEQVSQSGLRPTTTPRPAPVARDYSIKGMNCAACVGHVEKALLGVRGVRTARVNLATERAHVEIAGEGVSEADIEHAVTEAGYEARPVRLGDDKTLEAEAAGKERTLRRDLVLAAVAAAPVVALEMGGHLFPALHDLITRSFGHGGQHLLSFVLTSFVMFGPGLRFHKAGLASIRRGAPDMNALVAIGTGAAYLYSTIATFLPRLLPSGTANVYFESAAVIIVLILLGRLIEARSRGRTSTAIRRLVGIQPRTARVERAGATIEIGADEVAIGDIVMVRPGEKVPVDGEVTQGTSFLDQSMITGEPIPVSVEPGAKVIGGTINGNGSFAFRAEKVGADTLLAGIIRTVEEAQAARLPIEALVDKVTARFVPAVLAVAALTFLVWIVLGPSLALALVNAVAVLIIACPCAMGLATPTSIMVATGRAAELGILFRKGDALQSLSGVDTVAFDKTGTLTKGAPELTSLVVVPGFDRREALRLIAAAEARSEHPVARAIATAAEKDGIGVAQASEFSAEPGMGVEARTDGRMVLVGSARFLASRGVDTGALADDAARLESAGRSPLFAAIDGRLAAVLAVADSLKPNSIPAVADLKKTGLSVMMVTGDNPRTAAAIASDLGIEEVKAEVLPREKSGIVDGLKAQGRSVAFVGDGINDAPALAAADVGIALGTGTDVAIESADVVLMSGDIANVGRAIDLSKATMSNVRQNLFWAFAYNAALIPVAAGVLYPFSGLLLSPVLAAGAMSLSSLFVVSNALRLRRFAPAAQGEVR